MVQSGRRVADRHFGFGTWDLPADKALVLEFTPPECEYWIFQLCNMWQENLDNYEDGQGHVTKFTEKPKTDGSISAGFFVCQREIFDYLGGDECILEHEPLERLAREGQLMAYRHDGFFYAMDTFREYQLLNDLWKTGDAPWKVWA